MPRVEPSPEGVPSLLCSTPRCSSESSDTLRSLLALSVSTKLAPSFFACSSNTLLISVAQHDGRRVRQQQHHHDYHYPRCGGVLEDLLRAADPVVDLGGQRHVAVERAP